MRAFKSVGGMPRFIERAEGAYMYDADGNRYIDMIGSWGPMLVGHAPSFVIEAVQKAAPSSLSFGAPNAREVEMAKLICSMVPSAEKVRMVNSGTEATMSAIRLARGYTGRNKIIKLEGCYHGHGDSFLIAAGSGAATFGTPNSPGVTPGTVADTLCAPFNDLEAIQHLVNEFGSDIAALIVEPVAGNMGCVIPDQGYLQGLRQLCDDHSIVLIFDEVMTGFRLAQGGAQELLGVLPDITTLGKIIGGGMPVGAYAGKKEIMDFVSPSGPVYQAGTLSGNPIAMAAGLAMLSHLKGNTALYQRLEEKTAYLHEGMARGMEGAEMPWHINRIGSMITLFFAEGPIKNMADAQRTDAHLFKTYFHLMLQQGVYLPPSQYESYFLSDALSYEDLDAIIAAHNKAIQALK